MCLSAAFSLYNFTGEKENDMERLSLEKASEVLMNHAGKIEEREEISLWDAVGRVLA